MGDVLVVQYLISLRDAARIMKKLQMKKHRSFNWSFELIDLDCKFDLISLHKALKSHDLYIRSLDEMCSQLMYRDYGLQVEAFFFRVYKSQNINTE